MRNGVKQFLRSLANPVPSCFWFWNRSICDSVIREWRGDLKEEGRGVISDTSANLDLARNLASFVFLKEIPLKDTIDLQRWSPTQELFPGVF